MGSSIDRPGEKCEFKTYRHTKTKDGVDSIETIHEPYEQLRDIKDDDPYAPVINQFLGEKNQLEKTTVQINSPYLLKAFKEVVVSYPTISSDFTSSFELASPYQMLLHYWDELDQRRLSAHDATERTHLDLLFNFLDHEVGPNRERFLAAAQQNHITYLDAWCLFRPGDLMYSSVMGQPWLMRCEKTEYEENQKEGPYFTVFCTYTDSDGTLVGKARRAMKMCQKKIFGGANPAVITELPVYPLKFIEQEQGLQGCCCLSSIAERGRKWLGINNADVMEYDGMAQYLREYDDMIFDPSMECWEGVWMSCTESGRVILDRKLFQEDYAYAHRVDLQVSGDYDPLLCPPYTIGYSAGRKTWCRFLVDHIHEANWDENAWQSLIIPDKEKLILRSLVTSHSYSQQSPRDQMQQKGKGLVFLLHGTAGSGKTLTAETAAEVSHRALISTSAGELNKWNSPWSFEFQLKALLRCATTWKAIVLLDEADVFLEARDNNQSKRNGLVAIFLRELEYFSGIVFLTTNRIESFDTAMKSRIHLALEYSPPGLDTRRQLWLQLLRSIPSDQIGLNAEDVAEAIVMAGLNGREIANAVNTAKTIARFEGIPLHLRHIEAVLDSRAAFDASLIGGAAGDEDREG
ncbi:P-loop containing nucleoside triphosphate hydrolase protein [Aspergillus californicus]